MKNRQLRVGDNTLHVEVADTPLLRERGLSGRAGLPPDRGMLFVFDEEGMWGIWMKDMRFSIDILFAGASGEVNTLVADASPKSYPEVFYPHRPALYVVEVPAGWTRAHKVGVGAKIVVQ